MIYKRCDEIYLITCNYHNVTIYHDNLISNMSTSALRLSLDDDGEKNGAHHHMMIWRLRRNACIDERRQKKRKISPKRALNTRDLP